MDIPSIFGYIKESKYPFVHPQEVLHITQNKSRQMAISAVGEMPFNPPFLSV